MVTTNSDRKALLRIVLTGFYKLISLLILRLDKLELLTFTSLTTLKAFS
jgi:hypothetical protein